MSEQKLVSPLLDGYIMGDPMSSHDGVRCCPAMKENSDDKYIVKIISVPASQKQLDALLLTGAYQDAAAALDYFKELSDGIVKEAELLQQLSRLEGFLPYDGWQVVPMENNQLGYEVYLIGSYKRSLEKFLRRNTMTHLGAVNLGLDLCAALAICRRAGYMHIDLKPANIFLTGEREYRIGDLGFAKLSSLKYTSLPSKYRSCYTPPELHDALATLNPTVDIYAVGMILYQIYNNGMLPFADKAPLRPLPAPANADYEMAEIILKACDPNPRKRWQTPIEMGQALVSYMQRNTVNDVPIVPPVAEQPAPVADDAAELPAAEAAVIPADVTAAVLPDESVELPAEQEAEAADAAISEPAEESFEELTFMDEMVSDETAPSAECGDDQADADVTDEGSDLLSQVEELISCEVPDADFSESPVEEAPEADDDADSEGSGNVSFLDLGIDEDKEADDEDDDDYDDYDDEDDDDDHAPVGSDRRRKKKKGRSWIAVLILLILLALLGCGGYYYYQNYYLLPIDRMDINGSEDTITVNLTTEVDESILSVVCTDTYGNVKTSAVTNGQAVFTDLNPDTLYKITVEVEGFHQLTDSYYGNYTTDEQTNIVDFTAKTGTEDGSVILNFTVDGPETQDWVVEYTAEGEETKSVSFTGHMVAISGLTVDKTYTFTLASAPASDLWIVGSNTLEFNASKIVVAQNLSIVSCVDGVLTAQWNLPADTTVESWTVRCYSEDGYDQTVSVNDCTAQFSDISTDKAYTVEVTAVGMTQNARAYVSANPTTVSNITVEDSDPEYLTVSWTCEGAAPAGGWLLIYSLDGSEAYEVVQCDDNSGMIGLRIPKSTYDLSIQAADGSTVFGGRYQYTCPAAADFDEFSLSASDIQASLCPTPDKEDWTYKDIADDAYTSTYAVGQKASFVLYGTKKFNTTNEDIRIMYVIRDAEGNVLSNLVETETRNWRLMWNNRYASLDLPVMPETAGKYTIELYFNGAFVLEKNLTITE